MVRVKAALSGHPTRLIGPNCPGNHRAGKCKIGIMPGYIHKPGPVGRDLEERPLTYERWPSCRGAASDRARASASAGDPIIGTTFLDALRLFRDDPETRALVLIGEIGGGAEEEAARYAARDLNKPMVAFVAGPDGPARERMGHAGAIIAGRTRNRRREDGGPAGVSACASCRTPPRSARRSRRAAGGVRPPPRRARRRG